MDETDGNKKTPRNSDFSNKDFLENELKKKFDIYAILAENARRNSEISDFNELFKGSKNRDGKYNIKKKQDWSVRNCTTNNKEDAFSDSSHNYIHKEASSNSFNNFNAKANICSSTKSKKLISKIMVGDSNTCSNSQTSESFSLESFGSPASNASDESKTPNSTNKSLNKETKTSSMDTNDGESLVFKPEKSIITAMPDSDSKVMISNANTCSSSQTPERFSLNSLLSQLSSASCQNNSSDVSKTLKSTIRCLDIESEISDMETDDGEVFVCKSKTSTTSGNMSGSDANPYRNNQIPQHIVLNSIGSHISSSSCLKNRSDVSETWNSTIRCLDFESEVSDKETNDIESLVFKPKTLNTNWKKSYINSTINSSCRRISDGDDSDGISTKRHCSTISFSNVDSMNDTSEKLVNIVKSFQNIIDMSATSANFSDLHSDVTSVSQSGVIPDTTNEDWDRIDEFRERYSNHQMEDLGYDLPSINSLPHELLDCSRPFQSPEKYFSSENESYYSNMISESNNKLQGDNPSSQYIKKGFYELQNLFVTTEKILSSGSYQKIPTIPTIPDDSPDIDPNLTFLWDSSLPYSERNEKLQSNIKLKKNLTDEEKTRARQYLKDLQHLIKNSSDFPVSPLSDSDSEIIRHPDTSVIPDETSDSDSDDIVDVFRTFVKCHPMNKFEIPPYHSVDAAEGKMDDSSPNQLHGVDEYRNILEDFNCMDSDAPLNFEILDYFSETICTICDFLISEYLSCARKIEFLLLKQIKDVSTEQYDSQMCKISCLDDALGDFSAKLMTYINNWVKQFQEIKQKINDTEQINSGRGLRNLGILRICVNLAKILQNFIIEKQLKLENYEKDLIIQHKINN